VSSIALRMNRLNRIRKLYDSIKYRLMDILGINIFDITSADITIILIADTFLKKSNLSNLSHLRH
jgi:hypothetical protein